MNPASSSVHTPGVNYHATSDRLHYGDLSAAVLRAADVALGSPVVRSAEPVTSGFSCAYAGRNRAVIDPGRTRSRPAYRRPAGR